MDLATAHATLGIDASTPLSDAKAAYLARARLLHPDRFHGNAALRPEAERAMSQLNTAWEVIQRAGEHRDGGLRSDEPNAYRLVPRMPAMGECDFCGCAPAQVVTYRKIVGLVLFWRRVTFRADLCRGCATTSFREIQSSTLLTGWWGLIAPVVNIWALIVNAAQIQRVAGMPWPLSRQPEIVAPSRVPMFEVRPVRSRPGSWLVPALVATVVALVVADVALSSTRATAPSTGATDSVIGTCMDAAGYETPCGQSDAVWRITQRGPTCAANETVFVDERDRSFCARRT